MTNRSQANGSHAQMSRRAAVMFVGTGVGVGLAASGLDFAVFHLIGDVHPSRADMLKIAAAQTGLTTSFALVKARDVLRNRPGRDALGIYENRNGLDGGGRPGSGPSLNSSGKPPFLDR